jgi:hypothetical protein
MLGIFLQRKGEFTKVSNIKFGKLIPELVESLFFMSCLMVKKFWIKSICLKS